MNTPSPSAVDPDRAAGATSEDELARIAIITVSYNPDPVVLERQLDQLPRAALKVLVDNASRPELRAEVRRIAAQHDALLLQNETNLGLPAALNQGIRHAQRMRPECRFLLLLDQDTEPGANGTEQLLARYEQVATLAGKQCCIGPRLVDVGTHLDHGFHQIRGWRWSRKFPAPDCQVPVPLANLNGSGTLMPMMLFDELGGLEEDFFIDHVDTEWAFRVLAAGYGLYGIPDVTFSHRMGERSLRFWFLGWRIWPDRSPLRHYFLFRNALRLMRRDYVPRVWKCWALVKLGLTMIVHSLFDPKRGSQIRHMARGIREGLRTAGSKGARSATP